MFILNLVILLVLSLASYTTEKAVFTQEPLNVVHVSRGKTAMLVWKYRVDDREAEFAVNSPRWDFYASDGTISTIASDDGIHNWKWSLHLSTCPARLCNSTRVSKESQATLVISNVTADDSGVYGCTLVFQSASRAEITSKAVMIVTDPPYFTTRPPLPRYVRINEGKELSIPCTAGGTPEPNVTWVKKLDNDNVLVVIQQVGCSTLDITNITRDQSGTYACQATNDPVQSPITSLTAVDVLFPPEFSYRPPLRTLVTTRTDVVLKCSANGNPSPTISWVHLRGVTMVTLSKGNGSATLIIPNITRVQNGTYECQATNELKTVTALAAVIIMCRVDSHIQTFAAVNFL